MIYYASDRKKSSTIVMLLLIPFSIMFYNYQEVKSYYLGWSTNGFNNVRNKFMSISKEHNITRPTISNPDLGVMTWYKQLNDIDLGMLGSPIMAKLKDGLMMTEYYLNYGLPDLIEAHGYWINRYCISIFTQEKFNKLYSQVNTKYDMKEVCSSKKSPPMIYWIRNDIIKSANTNERILLDDLQNKLSTERIVNEITQCKASKNNCAYIARTTYKFIDELRESNQFDTIYNLFTSEIDKALLRGWKDGQAHEVIVNSVQEKIFSIPKGEATVKAEWNLYLNSHQLTYVKSPCSKEDTLDTFYLHVFPKYLKDNPQGQSFKNMDFHFDGIIKDNQCIIKKVLPIYEIKFINTGQYSVVYDKNKKRSFINHWKSHIDVK